MLRCTELVHSYGGPHVLDGVDLEIRAGELLAIVGPNGAGKTTLLKLLARLMRPKAGVVAIGERAIWDCSPRAFAQQVAYVPQSEGSATPMTVAETVGLGRAAHRGWFLPLRAHDREMVAQALRELELDGVANRLLGELSGGQQRRVTLARALAQEPRILLLDEPTVHLDLKHQTDLYRRLHRLARGQGMAVALTVHDLNEASCYADRIAILEGGKLGAEGAPEEVFTKENIERVYDVAVTVQQRPDSGRPWITVPLLEELT